MTFEIVNSRGNIEKEKLLNHPQWFAAMAGYSPMQADFSLF